MNCKPGDLAMYIGPIEHLRGFVVRVLHADPYFVGAWIHEPSFGSPGHIPNSTWDKNLRPIRDQDGNEPFVKTVSVDDQIDVLRRLNQRRKERA
jgi:hypothetical protein